MSGFFNEWFNPAEEVLPEQIITGEYWPYHNLTVTNRAIIFKGWAALQFLTSSSSIFWMKVKLSFLRPRSEFWSSKYVVDLLLNTCPSYTGFDRDLISRGRVKLIPVHLSPEQTFGPESLELFEQVYNTVTAQGIAVRAVVSHLLCRTFLLMLIYNLLIRSSVTHRTLSDGHILEKRYSPMQSFVKTKTFIWCQMKSTP